MTNGPKALVYFICLAIFPKRGSCTVKVSKFQNEFMKSLFLPKYEPKIVKISAL